MHRHHDVTFVAAGMLVTIDPASVLDVRQLITDLRRAGRTRGLLEAVWDRLADEQQLADPDLQESLSQMHRSAYVVRRAAG